MKLKYISFVLVVLFVFIAIQPGKVTFADTVKPQDCMDLFFSNITVGNELRRNAKSINTYISNMSMYYLTQTGRSMDYILLGIPCDSYKNGDKLYYSDGLVYFLFCYDSEDVITYDNGLFYYNGVEMYKNGALYDCTACTAYYGISVDTNKDEPYVNNGTGCSNSGSSLLTSIAPYKLNDLLKDSVLKIASNVKGFSDFNKVVNNFDDLANDDLYFLSPKHGAKIKSLFDKNYILNYEAIGKTTWYYDKDIFDYIDDFLGITNYPLEAKQVINNGSRFKIEYVVKNDYKDKIDNTVEYVSTSTLHKDSNYNEDFTVKINGDLDDWQTDGFYNYSIDGKLVLNKDLCRKSDSIFVSLEVPRYCYDSNHNEDFIVSNIVQIDLQTVKDTNNDGKDDATGEDIESSIMYDDNGDGDFEDKSNLGTGSQSDNQSFFEWLTSLVNDIKEFFSSCCSTLKSIVYDTSQMASSVWSFFDFLPNPIPNLIKTAFVLIILVTVVRYVRG